MKISTYKVPCTIKRTADDIQLVIRDTDRTLLKTEEAGVGTSDIVSLSKKLADENEAQKMTKKATLYASETEREDFLFFKYLEE